MKKIIAILAVAFITLGAASTANAAKLNDRFCTVGLHTGAYQSNLGLGVNFDFNAGNWRGRLMLDGSNLFNDGYTIFAPAVDFHYLLNLVDGLSVYPIVGVNAVLCKDGFNLGPDLGAGIEYDFGRFGIFAEGKYQYHLLDTWFKGSHYNAVFGFTFDL